MTNNHFKLLNLIAVAKEAVTEAMTRSFPGLPFVIDLGDLGPASQGILLLEACCSFSARSGRGEEKEWENLKDLLFAALLAEGVCWEWDGSVNRFYLWSVNAGQISVPGGNKIRVFDAWINRNRRPQEWAGVLREDLAASRLTSRADRMKMAAATDIRKSWEERLPDIRYFYPGADEEGNLFPPGTKDCCELA